MKKAIWWIVAIVVVVIAIVLINKNKAVTSGSATADTIKVGIIAPLSGGAASYGIEGKNSVVMALDEINAAGGIAGKKVEYFIEDGKCDPAAAVSSWNKLVSVNKVEVMFGGHCSSETLTIAPLAARDHIPTFAVFTTSPVVQNEGEWVFRHISTNEYYASVLADQAYKRGYRSIGIITEVKDFPQTYTEAFIKSFQALGGKIALDERFQPTDKDYRTVALKLKGLKYDAIFVSTQASDVSAMVTLQINDLGLSKPYIYNHGFAIGPYTKASNGYVPKDLLSVTAGYAEQSTKLEEFNKRYLAKFGTTYNFTPFYVAADYDIVHRYKDAVEACTKTAGGYSVDCVREQFKTATSYSGVAGDVTMSSKYSPHSILTPVSLVKISADGKSQSFEPIK